MLTRAATNTTLRALALGILGAAFALFTIGIPTDVVANPWFTRMTPVRDQDYVFLAITTILAGLLAASYAVPQTASCAITQGKTTAGGVLSYLAVGCPICNKIVVLLLGVSGALKFFEPVQPFLGVTSIALLGVAVWVRWRPVARTRAATRAAS